MKIFRQKERIFQLVDKSTMEGWDAEMPLLFIGYIREKRLPVYPKAIQKEVNTYLDEILKDIAIPKLMNALNSNDVEERKKIANNIVEVSESKPELLKIALNHIENACNDKNSQVSNALKKSLKNYQKFLNRKKTALKRKELTALRKKMDVIDNRFADGKISDEEYITEQKTYLKLKREIELVEQIE